MQCRARVGLDLYERTRPRGQTQPVAVAVSICSDAVPGACGCENEPKDLKRRSGDLLDQ